MTPRETAGALRMRLAAELAGDRATIDALARAIDSLLPPSADARGEWMRALALAFEVERWYTAVESTLARVLRSLDGDVPSGPSWHLDLLRSASVPVPGLRPALLAPDVAEDLRELLKFRHLARHGYESQPELARMEEHGRRAVRASVGVLGALDELDRHLRARAGGGNGT